MKSVLLPFQDQPYTLMYHNTAFPMGIIQANATKDLTPWLCGKYINCYFQTYSESNKFVNCITDNWAESDRMLVKDRLELSLALYDQLFGDMIEFIKKMLDIGSYVHGYYNEEFIPQKNAYQKEYYYHDFLLIGYDDMQNHFVSVGYLADGRFQRFFVPYDNMRNALRTLQRPKVALNFWRFQPSGDYSLNQKRIINELNDYLQSKQSKKIYTKGTYYGLEAMRMLSHFLPESATQNGWLDYRYIRGVMEHKFFMHMRIKYLLETGNLQNAEYLRSADDVYKISERAHMLGLKFIMTKKESILESLVGFLEQMIELEERYLPKVLDDLNETWRDGI